MVKTGKFIFLLFTVAALSIFLFSCSPKGTASGKATSATVITIGIPSNPYIQDISTNYYKEWLEVIGNSVDPETAISEIIDCKPDVVFSDLKMPTMSGTQLIKLLRDRGISCEFVMLSAFGTFEDARSFFLMEGFDYLLKPLQQADAELVLERLSRKLAEKECLRPTVSFSPSSSSNFDQLVQFVTENFNKKHTLATLSKKFGISPNYICNLFAKHYHSTLTIFLTNLRMSEAALQIRSSDLPFKEIAVDCGYRDYFYFCKAFKEYYGITPSQYRENGLIK